MRNTLTLLGMLAMVVACAEGDDERDDAAGSEDAGTLADDSGGTTGDDGGTMTATSMTSATSATTATTDPSGDPETTGGSDGSDDTGSDTTGSDELGCPAYCDMYLAACADFTEYANVEDCMANCAQWPIGEATDTAHDSVGCRLYHATVASGTDPELHCPHAGPSGDLTCVAGDAPTCDLYCTRYFDNCTGELNAFADEADCLEQCSGWYPGSKADVDGHTVGCHSYHAMASAGDPEMHCPHASPGGGGICVL